MCAVNGQRRESCLVSGARGPPIEGDPSVWTCMTNDYLIVDRLTTCEPQACADPSLGGSVWSDTTPTNDGWGLGDNGGGESAVGADDTSTIGWNSKSTTPKIPASTSYDGDDLAFQEEGTTTCTKDQEADSRVIASTTRLATSTATPTQMRVGSSPVASRRSRFSGRRHTTCTKDQEADSRVIASTTRLATSTATLRQMWVGRVPRLVS